MDNVLNDVLNSDEHSESEDSDGIHSETNDHENVNDSDLEIISSSTDGTESRREHEEDHEITTTNLGVIQPQTNSLLSILKAPKASSLARKRDSFTIEQRLVRIQLLAKSLTGEEIARELISVLSTSLGIASQFVVGTMRDHASVNNIAIRTIKIIYQNSLDIGCFSHTLDLVGDHFKLPNLTEFVSTWVTLFSHSTKTKFLWKEQTGKAMATYSHTRANGRSCNSYCYNLGT